MGALIFWTIIGFCIFLFNQEERYKMVAKSQRSKTKIVDNFSIDEDKRDLSEIREKVFEKHGRFCNMCGSEQNLQMHHIIPIRNGGTNELENLIPLCKNCHQDIHYLGQNQMTSDDKKGWFKVREKVFEKYGRYCSMCGSEQNVQVHHKIPIRDGGTNELENLIPLCRDCHQEIHHFVFCENPKIISSKYGQYTQKKNKFKKGFLILYAIKHNYRLKIKYKTHKFQAGIEENIRIIQPKKIRYGYEMTDNEFIMNAQYRKEFELIFVIAFCEMRQAKRIFRLDRMEILEVVKE